MHSEGQRCKKIMALLSFPGFIWYYEYTGGLAGNLPYSELVYVFLVTSLVSGESSEHVGILWWESVKSTVRNTAKDLQ